MGWPCNSYMLSIQSTSTIYKLPTIAKLLCNISPLFFSPWTLKQKENFKSRKFKYLFTYIFIFQDFKFPSTSHQSARNKSNKSLRKKEDDFLATCSDAITEISKNKNNDVDEFDALAITWVAKLRKLKEKQMVLAEGLISEVLKKAYFEELTRATVIKDDMVIEIATSSCHSWPSRSTELVSPRSPELVSPRSTENTQYNENNIPQDGQQSNTLMYYSQFSDQLLEL